MVRGPLLFQGTRPIGMRHPLHGPTHSGGASGCPIGMRECGNVDPVMMTSGGSLWHRRESLWRCMHHASCAASARAHACPAGAAAANNGTSSGRSSGRRHSGAAIAIVIIVIIGGSSSSSSSSVVRGGRNARRPARRDAMPVLSPTACRSLSTPSRQLCFLHPSTH
eukprot:363236-Chlamydomonas_euryale.AAC.2